MSNIEPRKTALTIRQLIEGDIFREQVAKALPRHLTAERFIRVAVTAMNRIPMLAQCDQASFFNALLTLSQLGLEPDGRRAHLIPFKNNKKGIVECQLIVDYKGIVELISNAGDVANIHADVVCENDDFTFDKGSIRQHSIDFKQPRGKVYAVYALIRFKDGTEKVEVMTREEIEAVRKRSRAAESGPWVTDWNEMAKKTVFRRASKWVKLSPEQRDAIEQDDAQFHTAAFDARPPIAAPRAIGEPEPPAPDPEEFDTAAGFPKHPEECEPPAEALQGSAAEPGGATPPQIRAIHAILSKLGIKDDLDRHTEVSNALALERVVTSMTELTREQASEAIKTLGAKVQG